MLNGRASTRHAHVGSRTQLNEKSTALMCRQTARSGHYKMCRTSHARHWLEWATYVVGAYALPMVTAPTSLYCIVYRNPYKSVFAISFTCVVCSILHVFFFGCVYNAYPD
jgi:hypothetical protein